MSAGTGNSLETALGLVAQHAARTPNAVAIGGAGSYACTYRALEQCSLDAIEVLNAAGIGRGDRVAIVLPNGPEMAVAFVAISSAAVCAPLNPAYRAEEFDFYLGDLRAKALVVVDGYTSPCIDVARARGIPLIRLVANPNKPGGFTLETDLRGHTSRGGAQEPSDQSLVLHTSGTTARPKIVPLLHVNTCTSARNIVRTLQLTPADRCLNVMPLFHIHGLIAAVLASLAAGATVWCSPGFRPAQFYEWFGEARPTWYTAVPTMHQAVLELAVPDARLLSENRLRFLRSSSAAMPPELIAKLEAAFGAPLIEAYGMTEAAHQMASNPLPPATHKPGSVGIAGGPEVAIMDSSGKLLASGDVGEVVIRGRNVFDGYENNPDANAAAFHDGWFRTGDEGRIDREGYLTLTGRLKEMINRAGEKIAPREVDEVLMAHPAVALAVTFAVPHATLGESVAAAIVLRPSMTAQISEIREYAARRLADFKVPQQMVIVDDIPKGPSGKLQRIGLADKLASQLAALDDTSVPRNETETVLCRIWCQVLKRDRVGIHDNYFALGGDSLLATVVAVEAAASGYVMAIESLVRYPTIAELAPTLVPSPSAAKAGADVAVPAPTSRVSIRTVRAAPAKPSQTVWLVDPMRGGGEACFERALPPEWGLRVFEDPTFRALRPTSLPRRRTVETIASDYLNALLEIQPRGPFLLAGWSVGGVIAYEMANRLALAGVAVPALVLVDAKSPASRPRWYRRRTRPQASSAAGGSDDDLLASYAPGWRFAGQISMFAGDAAPGWQRWSSRSLDVHPSAPSRHALVRLLAASG